MLRYIDHVILGVADLEGAARDYAETLGFAVNSGGVHPNMGTRNRLIVLDPEYIELIARLPGGAPAGDSPITAMLARAPGAIGFALASDDIERDVAAMRGRGVPVTGLVAGRLEGAQGAARGWRMAYVDVDVDAALGVEPWRLPFVIEHDSAGEERLARIARPEGRRPQPNGAARLDHVTVAVRDLAAGLRAYALAFGLDADKEGEDAMLGARTVRLPLPQGAIVLAAPVTDDGPLARGLAAHGEGLYSVTVAVDDLQGAVNTLRGRGVGVRVEEPDGVLVAARPDLRGTHGARLELVPED